MTETFERFLRSFSDDELAAFARDRVRARPPHWKLLRLALSIESERRGLRLEEELHERPAPPSDGQVRTGSL